MIYQIGGKYYVNIAPSIYVEVKFELSKGEVVIKPTNNKLEVGSNSKVIAIDFNKEKGNIKKKFFSNKPTNNVSETPKKVEELPKKVVEKSKSEKSFLGRRGSKRW